MDYGADLPCQLLFSHPETPDSFDEFFSSATTTCTHTHSCNPPGPSAAMHTHTCLHTHTQVLGSGGEDDDDAREEESTKPRKPVGNREAVRKYREKKKAHAAFLEEEVKKLRAANQQLLRRLQGHAALEAEAVRLRSLLLDVRGKIDAEVGVLPSQKPCSVGSVACADPALCFNGNSEVGGASSSSSLCSRFVLLSFSFSPAAAAAAAKSRRFRVGGQRDSNPYPPHGSPASPPPHVPRLSHLLWIFPTRRFFPVALRRTGRLSSPYPPSSLSLHPSSLLVRSRGAARVRSFPISERSGAATAERDFGVTTESQSYTQNSSLLCYPYRSAGIDFVGVEFRRPRGRIGEHSIRVLGGEHNAFCEDSVAKDPIFSAGSSCQTEMSALLDLLMGIFRQQTLGGAALELAALAAPLWLAALVGLLIGWAWRPRWAGVVVGDDNAQQLAAQPTPALATAVVSRNEAAAVVPRTVVASAAAPEDEQLAVNTGDLMHLWRLVEEKDGGPSWIHMMDRTLPTMRYQAWRRDPPNGPPQYRSSTIFEDASPEVVRDFFWDDEFRVKNSWDDMLLQHEALEECTNTGTMVVRWVRKFPFFCSDREYIIGRRIWASGKTFYCVTKGVPRPSVPRQNKPRRVDLYYSSWCIRPVESRKGDGAMTACEVLLFHHEDMGIPWEIAKLGVRQGMWGCVKRIEPGLRAYQVARTAGEPISKCAAMAHVTTRFNADELTTEGNMEASSSSNNNAEVEKPKHWTNNIPKVLMIGGAVALACTFDGGLLTKAVIFGTARRFAGPGRR